MLKDFVTGVLFLLSLFVPALPENLKQDSGVSHVAATSMDEETETPQDQGSGELGGRIDPNGISDPSSTETELSGRFDPNG